jgi:hypothetical protein
METQSEIWVFMIVNNNIMILFVTQCSMIDLH